MLLEAARAAARAASELLQGVRPRAHDRRGAASAGSAAEGEGGWIASKTNPKDLVTEWDLRSEARIREVLAEHTPGVPVLGEEGGQGAGSGGLRWVVDPIDGTVNFAHGLPIWCVSIACEDAQGSVVGVVAAPALGWWFEAERGGGARDAHGPIRVSAIDEVEHALLVTGFPYDRATNPLNNFAEWEHFQRLAGACRRLGSAALDCCLVANGSFDGYWERHLKRWDIAAGALIVAEAGGTVTNVAGGAFDAEAGDLVATNGAIHARLVTELATVARERAR